MGIRDALKAEMDGQITWSNSEIEAAIEAALGEGFERGWNWSVGTPGSQHFVSGFAQTEEDATETCQRIFNAKLNAHPACGSFDTSVWRESAQGRYARLADSMVRHLNQGLQ